jgi:hypothetical protein
MNYFGVDIAITSDRYCQRSATDHKILASEARIDRRNKGFNVDESYVLCLHCRKAIALKD